MFLFSADLHLSRLTFQGCPDAEYDSVRSFEEILRQSLVFTGRYKCLVPLVLGGDVWDSTKVSPDLLDRVIRVRNRYPSVPIYYINGNHDATEPSWTSFMKNTYRLSQEITTLGCGEKVVGIDYCTPKIIKESLNTCTNSADFLVIHQFVEPTENSMIASSIPVNLFDRFPTVLAGDIHKTQVINNQNTEVIYPGSTNRRTIREGSGTYMLFWKPEEIENPPLPFFETRAGFRYAWFELKSFRPLYTLPIDSLTLDGVPELVKKIQALPKTRSGFEGESVPESPFIVIPGDSFDDAAVRELKRRADSACHLIFRKNVTSSLEDPETSEGAPSALSGCAVDYAVQALQDTDLDAQTLELGKEVLLEEDAFFTRLNESFQMS